MALDHQTETPANPPTAGHSATTAPAIVHQSFAPQLTEEWVGAGPQWPRVQNDYGAIKLNCNIGNIVGWFGFFSRAITSPMDDYPAIISGYPGDKPLQQWQSSDKIRATENRQLFYANDTAGGMSGSPVWYDRAGPYAMAIHAYGTHGSFPHSSYDHGARIVRPVFDNLLSWKNAQ